MGLDMFLYKMPKYKKGVNPTLDEIIKKNEPVDRQTIWDTDIVTTSTFRDSFKEYAVPIKEKQVYYDMEKIFNELVQPKHKEFQISDFETQVSSTRIIPAEDKASKTFIYLIKNGTKTDKIEEIFSDKEVKGFTREEIEDIWAFADSEDIMYWRKANQIRQWFVDNLDDTVENCEYSLVTADNLKDLIDTIDEVLKDKSKADKLLPTSSGFFFGSNDYDEYYFRELIDTKEKLTTILKNYDPEREAIYYHEWW